MSDSNYHYTECGLDNVIIEGVDFVTDDSGDQVLSIRNINGLHRAIAQFIASRKSGISGKELRFLRTEMGMTQAEIADMIHREPLTVSRWERGEVPIDSNAETLIRLHAIEELGLDVPGRVMEISHWSIAAAQEEPITIDGSDPSDYRPLAA